MLQRRSFLLSLLSGAFLSACSSIRRRKFLREVPNLKHLAFGSCNNQRKPNPFWKTLLDESPDVLLLIGDNIYADTIDMKKMQSDYNLVSNNPTFKKLREQTRLFGTWDDHDLGANDAGGDYPMKKESQQLFLDFFDVPDGSPLRKQEGVYQSQYFSSDGKQVQIIVLDTRYFRSPLDKATKALPYPGKYAPSTDSSKTFLGEKQWSWLENELQKPADIRLIVSSIQVLATEHGFEKWNNFPHERQRLFDLLRKSTSVPTVFLSGDRHAAAMYRYPLTSTREVYEVTSSSFNHPIPKKYHRPEPDPSKISETFFPGNYGWIDFDWKNSKIHLSIRDETARTALKESIDLNALWHQPTE